MTHSNLRRFLILGVLSTALVAFANAATIDVTASSLYGMIASGEDQQPGTPVLVTVTDEGLSVAYNLGVSGASSSKGSSLPEFAWSSGSSLQNADAFFGMLFGSAEAPAIASVATPLSLNLVDGNWVDPFSTTGTPSLTGALSLPGTSSLRASSIVGDPPAATPEPASFAFLSVALACMLAFNSRSKRQRLND